MHACRDDDGYVLLNFFSFYVLYFIILYLLFLKLSYTLE